MAWTKNAFDDRAWVNPSQIEYTWNDKYANGEKQKMAEDAGHEAWLWMEGGGQKTIYCRLNQADYDERQENAKEGFRVCNRISSKEDGDHQYSAHFTYELGDRAGDPGFYTGP